MLLTIAAAFGGVAVVVPEARGAAAAAAALAISVAWFGVPALVRVFGSFTGDEDVLAHGTPAHATITALRSTGWRYNRAYPIVSFSLAVDLGGVRYPVTIKQVVDPQVLPRLAPGVVLPVRVDRGRRERVVIDWRQGSVSTISRGIG
jgi:hypothetical protein